MNVVQKARLINYTRFRQFNDQYGDSDNDDGDDERVLARRDATRQMQTAMLALPFSEKEAYLEACERAPRLVATESDPVFFLRFEKNHAEAASRRLARYWRLRRESFGVDRAFRPMNMNDALSGDGALTVQDVALFRLGWLLRLPNDKKNRPVLYFDRSKRTPGACPYSAKRIAFFTMQSCFPSSYTTTTATCTTTAGTCNNRQGLVLMLNLSNPAGVPVKDNVKFLIELFQDLPISLYQLHVVCRPPGGTLDQCSTLKQIVAQQQDGLRECFGSLLCFHIASSDDDCIGRLSAHDLAKDCLPVIFGGSWTAGGGSPWKPGYNSQLHLNIEPDPRCLIRNTLWYYIHSHQPSPQTPGIAAASSAENGRAGNKSASTELVRVRNGRKKRSPVDDSDAQAEPEKDEVKTPTDKKKAKIRVQHKIDSRKRRARLKIEEEVFMEQYWRQRNLNDSLKAEMLRLEGLVQAATHTVG